MAVRLFTHSGHHIVLGIHRVYGGLLSLQVPRIKGAPAIFADWRVYARFDPGDGHGRPCRLVFTLPQMQAPVMVTVQVQIPAGALPGSTFSVAAPGGGAPVQVQVPPGAVPGSTIFAQVPQAPGIVVVQPVPGGVELCAKQ